MLKLNVKRVKTHQKESTYNKSPERENSMVEDTLHEMTRCVLITVSSLIYLNFVFIGRSGEWKELYKDEPQMLTMHG